MKRPITSPHEDLAITDSASISKSSPKSARSQGNWMRYLVLGLLTNAAIWGGALYYIKVTKPNYSTELALSLPSAGSASNINLPGIGQASSKSDSPYMSTNQDPRENYKFLALSKPVLETAANKLNMPLQDFGKPRAKVLDNTTLMTFEFQGTTPEEAYKKSLALYEALQVKINELRIKEAAQQDKTLQSTLGESQKKLKAAQTRLSEYKARSGLTSTDQLTNLSQNIEQLRRQRAEVLAKQQDANARLQGLSSSLDLSAKQAADAFVLQADSLFQQYLQDYSEANSLFVALQSKFLPDHPALIQQQAKLNAAQTALLRQGRSLLKRPVTIASLEELNLSKSGGSGTSRDALFLELVTVQTEAQGLQAEARSLNQQLALLENRLKSLAQQEVSLADLMRDVQIAEAVFSSTLARLDLSKSNISSSYPQLQIFTEPTIPTSASAPNKKLVLLGAALGSLFCTNGLLLLWLRDRKISRSSTLVKHTYLDTSP
ncbi:hypothetical protein [Coleofasciculus sp. FACHB-501]|uniref:GumC family protein n=1 Tax=Cyanophyceae TaxID=3028117 RepID=UPI0018EFA497|nr:hypothetical protein [Coleofasciculus sp. FACHB-501]